MSDITSANSTFTLAIPALFPAPQTLQGYSADDAFTNDAAEVAQVLIGVDGIMSGGYTPFITRMNIMLQADSPSAYVFDQWLAAVKSSKSIFFAAGVITMPSINKTWSLVNGILDNLKQFPDARRVLQPVSYRIAWQEVIPSIL